MDILFVIPNATVVTMKGTRDQKRTLLAKGDMQAIKLDGNRVLPQRTAQDTHQTQHNNHHHGSQLVTSCMFDMMIVSLV